MKFEEYLTNNIDQQISENYLDYTNLKKLITDIIENRPDAEKILVDYWTKNGLNIIIF